MGVDRRTFLLTAAASGALAAPTEAQQSRTSGPARGGRAMTKSGFSEARLSRMHEDRSWNRKHRGQVCLPEPSATLI